MEELPPLPAGIRTLTDVEADRLRSRFEGLPASPEQCITCQGEGTFRWYSNKSENEVVDFHCSCVDQWILHRYLLHSGVGLTYQRLRWRDVQVEKGAAAKVVDYLDHIDAYTRAGCGLILYGTIGSGKTLLSTLLFKEVLGKGHRGYFTTFSEMLTTFMSTYRDQDEKQWFYKRVRNADILVLDDIGREHQQKRLLTKEEREATGALSGQVKSPTAVAESTLEDIIRHRLAQAKPTILTTNLTLDELQRLYGQNLMSLLHERSTTYRFIGQDFRDQARTRLDEEVKAGLTRPVVLG